MGESVEEATIIRWTKKPGDFIEADETVMEIATDKVDSDVPSPVSGKLVEQLYKDNDVVKVGAVIAIIETGEPDAVSAEPAPTFHQAREVHIPPAAAVEHTSPPVPVETYKPPVLETQPPIVNTPWSPPVVKQAEEPKQPVFEEPVTVPIGPGNGFGDGREAGIGFPIPSEAALHNHYPVENTIVFASQLGADAQLLLIRVRHYWYSSRLQVSFDTLKIELSGLGQRSMFFGLKLIGEKTCQQRPRQMSGSLAP